MELATSKGICIFITTAIARLIPKELLRLQKKKKDFQQEFGNACFPIHMLALDIISLFLFLLIWLMKSGISLWLCYEFLWVIKTLCTFSYSLLYFGLQQSLNMQVFLKGVNALMLCSQLLVNSECGLTRGALQLRSRNKEPFWGFPRGAVVGSPSANAGDTGSSPGLGGSLMPWSD